MMKSLFALLLICIASFDIAEAFVTQKSQLQPHNSKRIGRISSLSSTEEKEAEKEDKFSFQQRIESVKTAAVGALSVSCYVVDKVVIMLFFSCITCCVFAYLILTLLSLHKHNFSSTNYNREG